MKYRLGSISKPLTERQRQAVVQVSKVEARVGATVLLFWKRINGVLAEKPPAHEIRQVLLKAYPQMENTLERSFVDLAYWAWNSSVSAWGKTYHLGEAEAIKPEVFSVFDPPPRARILEIIRKPVAGETWKQRLNKWSHRIVSKEQLIDRIARTYSEGGNLEDLKRAILPLVRNVETTARRIARTEGMRIAGEMANETFLQERDEIVAYHLNATLDSHTRPEHRARDGRCYLPGPDGGVPWVVPDKPNCRCHWTPVFRWDPAPRSLWSSEPNSRYLGTGTTLIRRRS